MYNVKMFCVWEIHNVSNQYRKEQALTLYIYLNLAKVKNSHAPFKIENFKYPRYSQKYPQIFFKYPRHSPLYDHELSAEAAWSSVVLLGCCANTITATNRKCVQGKDLVVPIWNVQIKLLFGLISIKFPKHLNLFLPLSIFKSCQQLFSLEILSRY